MTKYLISIDTLDNKDQVVELTFVEFSRLVLRNTPEDHIKEFNLLDPNLPEARVLRRILP